MNSASAICSSAANASLIMRPQGVSSPALSIPSNSAIKRVQHEGSDAMRRIHRQHAGAGESPTVLRLQGMKKLLTAVQHRLSKDAGGDDGGGGSDGKAADVQERVEVEAKPKNQIVPKTLFGGEEASNPQPDAGAGMWWDAQFEKRQQLAQQQSIDRLQSRLLTCRLSRDGASAGASDPNHGEQNGHDMVTPLKQGTSAAKRAEAMRLTIAVPGVAASSVNKPLERVQFAAEESAGPHGGRMVARHSVEDEDEVDMLTPLNSASYVMHKRVQEVMRQVGGAMNKDTARRLLDRAQGDVRVAIAIARTVALPRTPRTKAAGLGSLEAGRRAVMSSAGVDGGPKYQPQTRLWQKAAAAAATSSALTPTSSPPPSLLAESPEPNPAPKPQLTVFDILPIGRSGSEDSPPGVGVRGDVVQERKKYVSSDPLNPAVKAVKMSSVLKMRLPKLLPDVTAVHPAVARAANRANAVVDANKDAVRTQHTEQIQKTGLRLMEVDGRRLMPVIVPTCSVPKAKHQKPSAQVAGAHAGMDGTKPPRPLPLPPGGTLESVGCEDNSLESKTAATSAGGAQPMSPDGKECGAKALPTTPKDQSPLRTMGSDGWVQKNDENIDANVSDPVAKPLEASGVVLGAQGMEQTPCSKAVHKLALEMQDAGIACTPGSKIFSSVDMTSDDTPGTNLIREMQREAREVGKERSALITERDLQLSLAPGTHNLLLEVKGLLRHSPMLSRLEHHQIVALLEGAEVQELRLGDVEGPLRGVSLLLSGSVRADYDGEISCGVKSLGHSHLRHVLTSGDVMCSDQVVAASAPLRGGAALMPCQLRCSLPSGITALSPCRLLRFSEERAERLLLPSVQREIDGQVGMLQGLPLFAWMSKEQVQDLLLHASLLLVPDGEVLVKAGDSVSDDSLVHLVVAGKVASALPLETNLPPSSQALDEAQGAAHAPAPAPQQLRCSLVREQGPGAHLGFSSMARQCASRTTIRSRGSCLVLTMECATVCVLLNYFFCSILLAEELMRMSL